METVRIYRLKWLSKDWPFAKDNFLDGAQGIKFVLAETAAEADLIVTEQWGKKDTFKRLVQLRKKPRLLWTDEPRYDTFMPSESQWQPQMPIRMNCFTGDVFHDIYRFLLNGEVLQPITTKEIAARSSVSHGIALMTFREGPQWQLRSKGVDYDLLNLRSRWAAWGHRNKFMDVCGRHWPKDCKVIEDSRQATGANQFSGWWERKQELLKSYRFNFALENTLAPNYVTEKLWDAIRARSLPIYWGQDSVDVVFPENSYIDCRKFAGPEELFSFVDTMSESDIAERINRCINVYNEAVLSSANEKSVRKSERLVVERCLELFERLATSR